MADRETPTQLAKAQRFASLWDGTEEKSVNLFRQQFDLTSTEAQRQQMQQLARAAGRDITKPTILRPHILTFTQEGITGTENRRFPAVFDEQYDLYITKVTASVGIPVLRNGFSPSAIFQDRVWPEDYIETQIKLSSTENITESFVPVSHVAGRAGEPYLWDILPFLPKRVVLTFDCRVTEPLLSANSFRLSLHCLRFGLV